VLIFSGAFESGVVFVVSCFEKKTLEHHPILCRLRQSATEQHSDEKSLLKWEPLSAEGSQI
jgi:hypothetical protein